MAKPSKSRQRQRKMAQLKNLTARDVEEICQEVDLKITELKRRHPVLLLE